MNNKYKFPLYNKLMFNFLCWIYKGNTEKQIAMIFKYGDPYGLFDIDKCNWGVTMHPILFIKLAILILIPVAVIAMGVVLLINK